MLFKFSMAVLTKDVSIIHSNFLNMFLFVQASMGSEGEKYTEKIAFLNHAELGLKIILGD